MTSSTSISTSTSPPSRAMAWDPKSPGTLLLPSLTMDPNGNNDEKTGGGGEEEKLRVYEFAADVGVGCNSHERSALIKVITAQCEYYKQQQQQQQQTSGGAGTIDATNVKTLSRSYRQALNECMEGWEGDEEEDEDESMKHGTSMGDLELLKQMYAVTQLSDVYLLMPLPEDIDDRDPWSVQGAVTADTVRYLRYNNMPDPFDIVKEGLQDILDSSQPEQYGTAYWELVQALVLRGCLDDAWSVLSRHSLNRRHTERTTEVVDEYHAMLSKQDREGFRVLKNLLLSAPLPGGRSEWNDSGLAPPDDDNVQGEEEDNKLLLEGVPRDSYKLWDVASCDDGPLSFDPRAANSMLKMWRRAVIDNASLDGLVLRIPQLQTNVIDILIGKFDDVSFESWSDAFCAELLYQRPMLCPKDMHVRAERIMKKLGASADEGFNKIELSVMEGNAGCAVETLYDLGGYSGAALPAVMTSLLCNLLSEAEQIPKPEPSSSFSLQTELLLSASGALLSSLSSSEPDLGVRLSTQLLLPYAKPSGDIRITATLGETLERNGPSTDAEARVLLDLCADLVARKSRRVLDGCVNLILFRYRSYLSEGVYGGAVHWLLKGIELEAVFFATTDGRRDERAWEIVNASGVFGALFCSDCLQVARALLADLVGNETKDTAGYDYARAAEMEKSIKDDDPSGLVGSISEVKLLSHVVGMANAVANGKGDPAIADGIIGCLKEIVDEDEGVVAPPAHCAMYRDLLSLAHDILKRDEARKECPTATFDVEGIRILSTKLSELALGKGNETGTPTLDDESMRLALCKGLGRAIVAENAKRQEFGLPKLYGHLGSAHSSKLSSYSQSDQEKIVQFMLGPSM